METGSSFSQPQTFILQIQKICILSLSFKNNVRIQRGLRGEEADFGITQMRVFYPST